MALGTYLSIYEAALGGCKMPTIERVMRNGRNRRSEPKQPERISPPLAAWCAGDESSGQSTVKSKIKQKKENNSSELRGGGGSSQRPKQKKSTASVGNRYQSPLSVFA